MKDWFSASVIGLFVLLIASAATIIGSIAFIIFAYNPYWFIGLLLGAMGIFSFFYWGLKIVR